MKLVPQERKYDLSRIEVVIVDDSPIILELLRMMLAAMDIRHVHCTTDPERALEHVANYRPHLVITDLLMNSIDGLTVANVIRYCRDEELRFTPIFVLSGFTDEAQVLRARDAGVHEVLAKPICVQTLYDRICNLIERPPKFIETKTYFGPDRQLPKQSGPELRPQPALQDDKDIIYIDVAEERPQ